MLSLARQMLIVEAICGVLIIPTSTAASATPQKKEQSPTEMYTPAEMHKRVEQYKQFFSAANAKNSTQKSYKDLTSADLEKLDFRDLDSMRYMFADEKYSMTDQLLPAGLSRGDFYRDIMREYARRGIAKDMYVRHLLPQAEQRTQQVQLIRTSFGTGQSKEVLVSAPAGVMAVRDAGVSVLLHDSPLFDVMPDFAAALGLNKDTTLPLLKDVDAYDLGYTVGSMPEFKGDPAKNPLYIRVSSPLTPEQLQQEFCPTVENIFKEGRAYHNTDSFKVGFVQARVDGQTNFEPVNEHVGVTAQCLPAKHAGK